jgi:hypothetical protein
MSFAKAELFSSSEADCFRGVEVKLRLALNDDGSGSSASSSESGSEAGTCPLSPANDAQQSFNKDAQAAVKPPAGLRNQGNQL